MVTGPLLLEQPPGFHRRGASWGPAASQLVADRSPAGAGPGRGAGTQAVSATAAAEDEPLVPSGRSCARETWLVNRTLLRGPAILAGPQTWSPEAPAQGPRPCPLGTQRLGPEHLRVRWKSSCDWRAHLSLSVPPASSLSGGPAPRGEGPVPVLRLWASCWCEVWAPPVPGGGWSGWFRDGCRRSS